MVKMSVRLWREEEAYREGGDTIEERMSHSNLYVVCLLGVEN